MDSYDIIFFAVISIIFLVRLWSVFGRQDESDDQNKRPTPPNPFGPAKDSADIVILPPRTPGPDTPMIDVTPHGYAAASMAGALDQLHMLDPAFNEKTFLVGAKTAFQSILEAFASGDLSWISRFLAPDVENTFRQAITTRESNGQTLENTLVSIDEAELTAARLDGTQAVLTVRFVSLQKKLLRDSSGTLLSGNPDKAERIEDLWTFARDSQSNDPNWRLIATGA